MSVVMNKRASNTPADHLINIAGLAYSMLSYTPNRLHNWYWRIKSHVLWFHFYDWYFNYSSTFSYFFTQQSYYFSHQNRKVALNPHLILNNVLLVPKFHCNLLSVSKFTQDSKCIVTFLPHSCLFQDHNQMKTLATSIEQCALYYFSVSLPSVISQISLNTQDVPDCSSISHSNSIHSVNSVSKQWHLRLGHASNTVLEHIPCIGKLPCNSTCPVCPKSKQTMLSFPLHSKSHATSIFFFVTHGCVGSLSCFYYHRLQVFSHITWWF